jgi:hypothetical protein
VGFHEIFYIAPFFIWVFFQKSDFCVVIPGRYSFKYIIVILENIFYKPIRISFPYCIYNEFCTYRTRVVIFITVPFFGSSPETNFFQSDLIMLEFISPILTPSQIIP